MTLKCRSHYMPTAAVWYYQF